MRNESTGFEESELEPPEWEPVLLGGLFREFGRGSWALTVAREEDIAEIERRAVEYGRPPVKSPESWRDSYLYAMCAPTWTDQEGHGVAFALTAFRHSFVDGFDVARPENVQAAAALGISGIPSFMVGDEVFWGGDRLDEALVAAAAF